MTKGASGMTIEDAYSRRRKATCSLYLQRRGGCFRRFATELLALLWKKDGRQIISANRHACFGCLLRLRRIGDSSSRNGRRAHRNYSESSRGPARPSSGNGVTRALYF